MLRNCIQQVHIPLLVWHSETDGHAEAKSAEEMFHYHTHLQTIPILLASQAKYARSQTCLQAVSVIQQFAHA